MSNKLETSTYQPEAAELDLSISTEWPAEDIEKVDIEVAKAAREIRQHYYRQLPLLRQIPYLALEANGRGGWLEEWYRVYRYCIYRIPFENRTSFSTDMFIELRSGAFIKSKISKWSTAEKVIQFGEDNNWRMADDKEVYTKLAHQNEERRFRPIEEIKYWQEKIRQPYHNDPEAVERALKEKEEYKIELDRMMQELPEEQVVSILREQGFDL